MLDRKSSEGVEWRETSKSTLCLVVAALTFAGAGCGSIAGRGDSMFYPGVYPGVRCDIYNLAHPEAGDMPQLRWFAIPDFPFSAALDTVLLP
jgi:uncharacterized protein YceK